MMNVDPTHNTADALSPAGHARKQAMLGSLQREVVTRGRRRRAARAALVVTPVAIAIIGGLWLRSEGQGHRPSTPLAGRSRSPDSSDSLPLQPDSALRGQLVPEALASRPDRVIDPGWALIPHAPSSDHSHIRIATADADLLARSRYHGEPAIADATDAQLAAGLRAAGRAAGVVRTPTGVQIVPDVAGRPG